MVHLEYLAFCLVTTYFQIFHPVLSNTGVSFLLARALPVAGGQASLASHTPTDCFYDSAYYRLRASHDLHLSVETLQTETLHSLDPDSNLLLKPSDSNDKK